MWQVELPDMRTIKQHLIVDHRRCDYCPICYAVFDRAADRDRHIVARSCRKKKQPEGLLVGVSEDQAEVLARRYDGSEWTPKDDGADMRRRNRANTKITSRNVANKFSRKAGPPSEEEKWFYIWDIVFPTTPHPASPYLSSPLERETVALRSFWQSAGPELVAEALKEHHLPRLEDTPEEGTLAALHTTVLKCMAEKLVDVFR
jgi:5-methylcytosine-specific restriction endonuclease McrA